MRIHESGENYLEQILILSAAQEKVRAVDICTALGFSRPTVSVMLRDLKENGYVTVAENGSIALTEAGLAVANRIYERHLVLTDALVAIGVDEKTARLDACKIEHDISDEAFEKIKAAFAGNNGKKKTK